MFTFTAEVRGTLFGGYSFLDLSHLEAATDALAFQ